MLAPSVQPQASDIFGWSPETWTAIGTLSLAGVTLLALAAGPCRRWLNRARLKMEIQTEPPDTHMIEMRNVQTGAVIGKVLYVRVRVSHARGDVAEGVELLAAKLWRIDPESGGKKLVSHFLPLSLSWSHVGGATIRVPRKSFRLCDLGHFGLEGSQTMLFLDTIVQPYAVGHGALPNLLPPGEYEIELQLSGDNATTKSGRWRIAFGSEWSDDEKKMLRKVQVEPLPSSRLRWPRLSFVRHTLRLAHRCQQAAASTEAGSRS
jgi:hypothetical protein